VRSPEYDLCNVPARDCELLCEASNALLAPHVEGISAMRYVALLAVFGTLATVGAASATYRLSSNPSIAERDRYETYHASINQFHAADSKEDKRRDTPKMKPTPKYTGTPQIQQGYSPHDAIW
jgi:hypothetical protein